MLSRRKGNLRRRAVQVTWGGGLVQVYFLPGGEEDAF